MPIVHPSVPDEQTLADLLAWPAATGPINRIQLERSDTGGGAGYSNIGSVTLVAGTLVYTFYDEDGTTGDWYRWYPSNAANTFPTAPERDYSTEIQSSEAGAGLICSVGDVKQELGRTNPTDTADDELILDHIRQVTAEIHSITGRLFVRTPASGTDTFLFDVYNSGRLLRVPKGIAAATLLEVATQSQPESAGTYAVVPVAEWFLRPTEPDRDDGWPATSIVISNVSGSYFAAGYNTVRLTGALGFATVPYNIQGVGIRASAAATLAKGSVGNAVPIGPNGGVMVLRNIAPADRETLMRYQVIQVG